MAEILAVAALLDVAARSRIDLVARAPRAHGVNPLELGREDNPVNLLHRGRGLAQKNDAREV